MNVLFLCRYFYPHIGGVEKHVFEVSKRLVQKGYSVTVVTELHDTSLPIIQTYQNIRIYRIPIQNKETMKKFEIWKWMYKNKRLLLKADLIHCHDVFYWYLPFRFLFLNKPVFTTFHGYEKYPISKRAIIIRKISEKLSKGNICIGKFIHKWYKTHEDFISYGGVTDTNKHNGNYKKHSALFIGRLDSQTSIKTYINAIKYIKQLMPDFMFEVIGEGILKRDIPKSTKVKKFQAQSISHISRYQYAFVSRYLTMLEAMVSKRLVFAVYDNKIKEDYLLMSPFRNHVVIAKDARDLSKKVLYYLANPYDEQKKVKRAYSWAKKQTWEHVVEIYLRLWKKSKQKDVASI